MYKVNVITTGKYGNWVTGERYILGKRNAKKFIADALDSECKIIVEKFGYICDGVFGWTDDHDLYGGIWYEEEEIEG